MAERRRAEPETVRQADAAMVISAPPATRIATSAALPVPSAKDAMRCALGETEPGAIPSNPVRGMEWRQHHAGGDAAAAGAVRLGCHKPGHPPIGLPLGETGLTSCPAVRNLGAASGENRSRFSLTQ